MSALTPPPGLAAGHCSVNTPTTGRYQRGSGYRRSHTLLVTQQLKPGEAWVMNGAAGSEPDGPADQEALNRTGHLKVEKGSSLKGISKC